MEKKITAVEFIYHYMMYNEYYIGNDLIEAVEQAKKIEKEQIESAFRNGECPADYYNPENPHIDPSENFYNETYGRSEKPNTH